MKKTLNLRDTALQIFHRTLAAIDVESVVRANLKLKGDQLSIVDETVDLNKFKRILAIGIGKACPPMARAIEALLGDRITGGMLATNAVIGESSKRLPVLIGGHPLPNEASLEAASTALRLLRENDSEDTLVIFLVTGGGSAMFERPIDENLTLDDLQGVNRALVGCGAVINEMNVVRKHLSAVKGGRLAAEAPKSRQVSLYISDVNSDDLTTVASGPALPDKSTLDDFHRIVERYRLLELFPPRVASLIASKSVSPMPGSSRSSSQRRSHHLLLDNRRAMIEAKRIAEEDHHLVVEIADDLVEGDVETMMLTHIERAVALRDKHRGKTVCLISGGEVICPVRGDGQGGRNQEFALRAAIHLHQLGMEDVVVLSSGTDGIDGNSPAGGAIADSNTIRRAEEAGLSAERHLQNSDSFNFFNKLGDAIMTGPTGNNVRDLRILLARRGELL
jgi:hydroxypyruvate reductase